MVDVCLVVEGSWPYVTGGVSAWTQGLLQGLPGVRFAVAHVRDAGDPSGPAAYAPPPNARIAHVELDPEALRPQAGLHRELPEARVYHAACTGAAGELARLAAAERGAAFALTEHGLAWREARWGISGCKLHAVPAGCKLQAVPAGCKFRAPGRPLTPAERRRHADAVLAMAVDAYAHADVVTSVCGPNAAAQRALGATAPRVLPNAATPAPVRRVEREGFLAAFVGRVVAIKDVETFLRACALVAADRPDARFAVVGPTHHEPEYAERCVALAAALGLEERVTFTGETDPAPWLARMDALVLTSLSEAQPLVALDAMAAGVPVVATDVGGCREAVGSAGLITPASAPQATAAALLRLAGDEVLRARLGTAGRRRAAARHDARTIHAAYGELYERLAA